MTPESAIGHVLSSVRGNYIYYIHSELRIDDYHFELKREQGRLRGSIEGARECSKGALREHGGARREHRGEQKGAGHGSLNWQPRSRFKLVSRQLHGRTSNSFRFSRTPPTA